MDNPIDEARWGRMADAAEADLPEYRALPGLAVVGFLVGLLSFLGMFHLGLLFIAGAAVLLCVAALIRISAAPSEMSGRWLAILGLILAIFWTAASLAREMTHQKLMDVHSREIAGHWFEFLKRGEPEKALELERPLSARRPFDDKLWDHYLSDQMEYEGMQGFVARPEVLALLTLGDRAEVRHYAYDGMHKSSARQIYAVTYEDQGTQKSFLVRLTLERADIPDRGVFAWNVEDSRGPWNPEADNSDG